MKQYVIDELRPGDFEEIRNYFNNAFPATGIEGIYRIPIDSDMLTDVQKNHTSCGPHYFAVELVEPDKMVFELLIRAQSIIRCNCIAYANEKQRNWMIAYADSILERLEIQV